MGSALLSISLTTIGGVLLALAPERARGGWGFVRSFALVASLGVLGLHLMPEALGTLHLRALVFLGLGALGPALLERGAFALSRATRGPRLAFFVGLAGLGAHSAVDGLTLFELEQRAEPAALVALAAHMAPVTGIVALQALGLFGRGGALLAALALAGAAVLGTMLAGVVPDATVTELRPAITATAGGLLLHATLHGLGSELPSGARPTGSGWSVALGAILGVAVSLGPILFPAAGEVSVRPQALLEAALQVVLRSALPLVLGLAVGAVAATRISSRSRVAGALEPGRLVAHGLAFGLPVLVSRVLGEGALSALASARGVGPDGAETPERGPHAVHPWRDEGAGPSPPTGGRGAWWARVRDAHEHELVRLWPTLAAATVAGAIIDAHVPDGGRTDAAEVVMMALAAVPCALGSLGALPLMLVLAQKGLSLGALMVGLSVRPALGAARVGPGGQALVGGVAILAGLAMDALLPPLAWRPVWDGVAAPAAQVAALVLLVLALRGLRRGESRVRVATVGPGAQAGPHPRRSDGA